MHNQQISIWSPVLPFLGFRRAWPVEAITTIHACAGIPADFVAATPHDTHTYPGAEGGYELGAVTVQAEKWRCRAAVAFVAPVHSASPY